MANIRVRAGRYNVQVRMRDTVENRTFDTEEDAINWANSVEKNISTNHVGLATELLVMAKLTKDGHNVLKPVGVCRYDIAYEKGGQFKKVQIKTAKKGRTKGSIMFNAFSINTRTNTRKLYSKEDVDEFMIMYKDNLYVIPISEVTTQTMTFRVQPADNNQKDGVRDLKDYLYV